jgi:hypothetical protein
LLQTVWDDINLALTTGHITTTVKLIIVAVALIVLLWLLSRLGN